MEFALHYDCEVHHWKGVAPAYHYLFSVLRPVGGLNDQQTPKFASSNGIFTQTSDILKADLRMWKDADVLALYHL
jgi:hypothetical protein